MKKTNSFIKSFLSIALLLMCIPTMNAGRFKFKEKRPKIPVVYHPNYNFSGKYLAKFFKQIHNFDSAKFIKVFDYLTKKAGIAPHRFHKPSQKISKEQLLKVHTPSYLKSLKKAETILKILQLSPEYLPNSCKKTVLSLLKNNFLTNFCLQQRILNPMMWQTQGTIDAALLALDPKYKGAINLGGGFHHAKLNKGEGYCPISDIMLAITIILEKVLKDKPYYQILIVDLDAHRGNGHESYRGFYKNDKEAKEYEPLLKKIRKHVKIFDLYNEYIFPKKKDDTAQYITHPCSVPKGINDDAYLNKYLKPNLEKAIEEIKPDFIFYIAGTDIYEHDPLGGFKDYGYSTRGAYKVTKEGIIERDRFVFEQAIKNNIPIVMTTAGGYHNDSAQIVAESVENILKEFNNLKNS